MSATKLYPYDSSSRGELLSTLETTPVFYCLLPFDQNLNCVVCILWPTIPSTCTCTGNMSDRKWTPFSGVFLGRRLSNSSPPDAAHTPDQRLVQPRPARRSPRLPHVFERCGMFWRSIGGQGALVCARTKLVWGKHSIHRFVD